MKITKNYIFGIIFYCLSGRSGARKLKIESVLLIENTNILIIRTNVLRFFELESYRGYLNPDIYGQKNKKRCVRRLGTRDRSDNLN